MEDDKAIGSPVYENTSEELFIKEESQTVEDLLSEEYESSSKAAEIPSPITEDFSDVGTTETIIKEESSKSPIIKEELPESEAKLTVSMAFEDMTSDLRGTSFDLSFTGNPIKEEALEMDNETEDEIDCVVGYEVDAEEDPLAEVNCGPIRLKDEIGIFSADVDDKLWGQISDRAMEFLPNPTNGLGA